MPTDTTNPPVEAPATSGATTTETNTAPASKDGGFISNALSALKTAQEGRTAEDTPPVPEEKSAPAAPEAASPSDGAVQTKEQASTPDEDDVKADADIKRETANMTAAHRAAFTKLRYEARDLKRQLKAALDQKESAVSTEGKAEASEEVARLRAEYDALKEKLGTYEKEVYTSRLEATEVFQNEVSQPRQSVAESISAIAQRYDALDQDAVISAVRSGDPERVSRVTADMSEFDRYRFYNLVDQYQAINQREEQLRANSKENLEKIYRDQREKEEAKKAEERSQWESSLDKVWKQLEEEFPVLAAVEGDDDWNSKVQQVKAFAAPDRFDGLTVSERAEALYRAAAFPVLAAELEAAVEELKSAQEKLSKYEGATPGVSNSGPNEPPSGPAFAGEGSFIENALSSLKKAGYR